MLAPRKKLWSTPSSAVGVALDFAQLEVDDVGASCCCVVRCGEVDGGWGTVIIIHHVVVVGLMCVHRELTLLDTLLSTTKVYDVGCGDGRVLIQMASMSVQLQIDTTNCENKTSPSTDSTTTNTAETADEDLNIKQHQRHHCHNFIGIEISPERTLEAQINIQNAKSTNIIPPHVNIEVMCANALEVDYGKATVVFLYLVPRGLRLMKPILWGVGRTRDDTKANETSDGNETVQTTNNDTTLQTQSPATATDTEATVISTSQTSTSARPRRIITYMTQFENESYVKKKYCKVEHQEGANWPVYLYHVG